MINFLIFSFHYVPYLGFPFLSKQPFAIHLPNYRFTDPYMQPAKIEVLFNTHVFDPPSVDYYDQIYRRGADLYDNLQLDWVYLFIAII